jgi:hypothetical protein
MLRDVLELHRDNAADPRQRTRVHGGESLHVFNQFGWLEVDSVKMSSPRPAHQHSRVCFATLITLIRALRGGATRRVPREYLTGQAAHRWAAESIEHLVK